MLLGPPRPAVFRASLPALFALTLLLAAKAQAQPPVEFELATQPGFPLTGTQQWIELFSRLEETSVRIHQAQPNGRPAVENRGTAAQPVYRVAGVLTARNRLVIPGGEFGPTDRTRLAEWIKKLREDGESAPTEKTGPFGLTDEQLVAFHDRLAAGIGCATRGRRLGDVARDIVRAAALDFVVTEAARVAFASPETCRDDLQPLSCGAALAAVVRPLGLAIRPDRQAGRKVRLKISAITETEEAWPVGWPPQEIPAKVAPTLFESLKVTITNQSVVDVLAAIQPRIKIPFVLDYHSLAEKRIVLEQTRVSYTKEVDTYQKILGNVFFQARLSSDLKVDEAGQPFLWVTAR